MTIEAAIYNRLSNFAGLTALVSARIFPNFAPKDTASPYVVFHKLYATPVSAMSADPGLTQTTYRVSIFAKLPIDLSNISAQINLALQRWSGTLESTTIQDSLLETNLDMYEVDTQLHHRSIQFEISHAG